MRLDNPEAIGRLLRNQRRAAGLTQQQLADRIGVSRRWVGSAERGNPRSEILLVMRALQEVGTVLLHEQAPVSDLDKILLATRSSWEMT